MVEYFLMKSSETYDEHDEPKDLRSHIERAFQYLPLGMIPSVLHAFGHGQFLGLT